jgi:hypothetical protein
VIADAVYESRELRFDRWRWRGACEHREMCGKKCRWAGRCRWLDAEMVAAIGEALMPSVHLVGSFAPGSGIATARAGLRGSIAPTIEGRGSNPRAAQRAA